MKKNTLLFLLLLVLLLPTTAIAHDFEVDGIYYNINGTEATVTYLGTYYYSGPKEYSGDVIIPATVTFNGTTYSVTSIGDYTFWDCSGLTSIVIPNSVTSIGDGAFSYCSSLTSIDIPNSVTTIGSSAFSSCENLTSIVIPNSVASIGTRAFWGCNGLTSITIPNSVTTIGDNPFFHCNSLLSIAVETDNPKYDSRNNCNAIIETASNALIVGCRNTVIPNSVTVIGNWAFSGCSSLTNITIPNSVTTKS